MVDCCGLYICQYGPLVGASMWFDEHNDRKEPLQIQTSFGSYHAQGSLYGGIVGHRDPSSDDSITNLTNPVNPPCDLISGTGVKIRSRQAQIRPNLDNFINQGTASRRLRLKVEPSPSSVAYDNKRDMNRREEEDEVQSYVSEVSVLWGVELIFTAQ